MKFRSALAAFAAISTLCSTPVLADRGKPAERVWMNGAPRADIVAAFLTGKNPCVGSSLMHTCYAYSPVTEELQMQQVSRPKGLGKNLVINTVAQLTSEGLVMRNEAGVIIARYQAGSEQQNAASLWTAGLAQMPAAFANGMGSTMVCTIAGCGSNGGGGATAISVSDAAANQFFEGFFGTGGGCTTGSCAYRPKE